MKSITQTLWFRVLALVLATAHLAQAVTINLTAAILRDHNGVELADGSTLMVIASTGNSSFGNLTSPDQASATSFTNEADDRILARFALDSSIVGIPGAQQQAINFNLGDNGITGGSPLIFVWYEGLNEAGNPTAPGAGRRFGTFRAEDWVVPGDNSATIFLSFLTESGEGSLPDAEGNADQITAGQTANNPPQARCQDVFVSANASCVAAVLASDVNNGSTDPDGDPLTLALNPAGPYPKGATPVTLIVADNRGGTNTCAATITVLDTTNPTVTCPGNITTNAPAGQTSVVVNFPNPTGSDNCPGVTFSTTPASGTAFPLGQTIVTGRAIDAAGNTNTCTFTVTVNAAPNQAPTAICQNVTKDAGANCTAAVAASEVNNGSTDPDGDPLTFSLSPAGPYAKGTNNVTLTVADNRGGTNTCNALVIVRDVTAPTITCPSDITVAAAPGQSSAVVNLPDPTTSDNCGVAGFTYTPASGSSFPVGTNTVTGRAFDAAGNTNSCTFKVIVTATAEPCVLTCPSNLVVNTGSSATQCGAIVNYPAPQFSGGCGTVISTPASGAFFPVGTTTVNVTTNGSFACAFTVTVVDTTLPVLTCPSNIVTSTPPGETSVTVNFPALSATDNCAVVGTSYTPASGTAFGLGTNAVTARAWDAAGNTNACVFQVIVTATPQPNLPPTAVCQPVTNAAGANCSATITAAAVDGGSFDPDGTIASRFLTPTAPFALGTTPVTLTVVDNAGASNSCQTTVTVVDTTPPTVTCPAPVTVTAPVGEDFAVATYGSATVTDNCPGATVTCLPVSGSSFPVGTNTVTCTAVDAAGNTNTCSFSVIVNRATVNEPPTAICQDVTKSAGANCTALVTPAEVDNGSTDSDGTIVTRSLSPAGPYPVGQTIVTLAVVDNAGAESTCQATITITDTTAPSVTCPANQIVNVPTGETGAVVNFPAPTVSDNCGTVTVTATPASGTFFALGTTPVLVTAVDAAGNTNTCTFTVTVREMSVTACDTVDELRAKVLATDLNRGRQRALLNQLTLYERAQTRPRLGTADRHLEQFIKLVENFQQAGALDATTAAELINCARNIGTGN
jgi:hypothetical protein